MTIEISLDWRIRVAGGSFVLLVSIRCGRRWLSPKRPYLRLLYTAVPEFVRRVKRSVKDIGECESRAVLRTPSVWKSAIGLTLDCISGFLSLENFDSKENNEIDLVNVKFLLRSAGLKERRGL